MQVESTIVSFFILALIILGIITGVILWYFPRSGNTANKILAVAVAGILWALTVAYCIETHLIIHLPHLYRTGYLASLVFTPLLYLYVRSMTTRKGLAPVDIVHLIPALIFLTDYLPFFVLDANTKQITILEGLSGLQAMSTYDEGWLLPSWFLYSFRYIVMLFYLTLQARIVYLLFRKRHPQRPRIAVLRSWLFNFTVVQILGFVPLIVRGERFHWIVLIISVALPIVFTALWLFFMPEILYGLHIHAEEKTEPVRSDTNKAINGHPIVNRRSREDEFQGLLHKYMSDNEKFLQHKYSIQNLANDLNMPPHQISHLLNQHLHISFHDFLNQYRIERCIERIKKGDAQRLTLEALSFECGFSNRNSFISAFKRFTGITPSDYMRSLNSPIEKQKI